MAVFAKLHALKLSQTAYTENEKLSVAILYLDLELPHLKSVSHSDLSTYVLLILNLL